MYYGSVIHKPVVGNLSYVVSFFKFKATPFDYYTDLLLFFIMNHIRIAFFHGPVANVQRQFSVADHRLLTAGL